QVWRVGEQLLEVVARGVVEGEAGDPSKLWVEVLELLAAQLCLLGKHLFLGIGEHAIEPTEDRKRQDYVLVFPALEGVTDQVGDAPKELDDLAMVHINSQTFITYPSSTHRLALRTAF